MLYSHSIGINIVLAKNDDKAQGKKSRIRNWLPNNDNLHFKIKQNYFNGESIQRNILEQLDTHKKRMKNKKGREAEGKEGSEE